MADNPWGRKEVSRGNAGRSPSHRPSPRPSIDPSAPLTAVGNKRKRSEEEHHNPRPRFEPRLQPSHSGHSTKFTSRASRPLQSHAYSCQPTFYGTLQSAGFTRSGIVPNKSLHEINKFYPGQIIHFSHHATAQDPTGNPLVDANFVQAKTARISSKYRYEIVLVIYDDGRILILPMYTHGGKGISGDRTKQLEFYMLIAEEGDHPGHNPTPYGVLNVQDTFEDHKTSRNYKVSHDSSVCLTESYTIQYNEHVDFVGRLDLPSTLQLLETYQKLKTEALDRSWGGEKEFVRKLMEQRKALKEANEMKQKQVKDEENR